MNEQTVVEKKRSGPPRGVGGAKKMRRFTPNERLKAGRLPAEVPKNDVVSAFPGSAWFYWQLQSAMSPDIVPQ